MVIIRRGPRKQAQARARINNAIIAREVRVLSDTDENLGIFPKMEALKMAREQSLDLVELSSKGKPPIVKITNYGKYQYTQNKLKKEWRIKDKQNLKGREIKMVQIKPGTSGGIIELRIKKIEQWLEDGNRVKVDLFLFGRYKTMGEDFLKGILEKFLSKIKVEYKLIEEMKKSSKGFSITFQKK